jgi:hypothetical protein
VSRRQLARSIERCKMVKERGGSFGHRAGLVVREHVRLPGLILVSAEVGVGDRLTVGVLDPECLLKFTD